MRNTRKILIAVLVVLTLLISMAIVASAASVRITGSFNGWGTAANTSYVDGLYVYKVDLTKGSSYTFKVYNGSWLGNGGTIDDTTITSTYNAGWDFKSSDGDCTLKATTGGTYIFQWNDSTKKLNVFPHNSHELKTETVAATCTENGSATHTCTVAGCGHVETEVLQAPGHSYVNGSCSVCGEAEPTEHVHFYVESVKQAPTCTVPGIKSFDCACGEDSYTEEIEVIPHSYKYGYCTVCEAANPDYTFYLEGYINNADYTGTKYAFVNGELTIPAFTTTSYIYVTDSEGHKFMTSAYSTATSDTFRIGGSEKMLIPTGFDEVKYTIVNNKNGTVTLSYEGISSCDHNWVDATCQEPRHCTVCEQTDGENLVNHYYVDGTCTWCTATISAWTTVYADNAAGWETVYCYAWSNTESIGTYHAWPGKAMTLGEDGLWSAQIPSSYDNVIFCNNNGTQSADLKVPTTSKVIYNNSTESWSCKHSYAYSCDAHCQGCGELTNPDAAHTVVHVEAKAATCTENGNVEYWNCSVCGSAWLDEAQTQVTNQMSVVVPAAHSYFYPCDPVCQVCYEITNPDAKHDVVHVEAKAGTDCQSYDGNVEYWYCSHCNTAWLDAEFKQQTNLRSVVVAGAHSFAEGKCSVCGETDPNYVPPHVNTLVVGETNKIVVTGDTLNAAGAPIEWVEFVVTEKAHYEFTGDTYAFIYNKMDLADFAACVCGFSGKADLEPGTYYICIGGVAAGEFNIAVSKTAIVDPDAPVTPVAPIVNVSDLAAGTTTGDELIAGTGISASAGLSIDSNSKSVDGFEFTLRLKLGGTMKVENGEVKAGIKIVTNGAAKIVLYAISSSGDDATRTLQIATLNEDGTLKQLAVSAALDDVKHAVKVEFTVDAAGTYYVGSTKSGINLYYIAVEENSEPAHENKLVVGEINKIVVSGNILNAVGAPIEWVEFVVTEKAHYEFTGDTYALIYNKMDLADLTACVCGFSGKADLEPGTYYICIGGVTTGEFNITVTQSAILPQFVLGENKIVVTGNTLNAASAPIEWVKFVVTEKAHYEFTGDTYAFIYSQMDLAAVPACGFSGKADLEPGTYYILVGGVTTGEFTITATKSEIAGGEDPVKPELPALVLGDNTVTIDGSVVNLTGSAITWLEFVVAEDGIYTVSSADLNCYIYSEMNLASADACLCKWTGTAELTAGTYYVCVGKEGVTGEFTVKAEKLGDDVELPAVNTIVVGENKYVLNQALKDKEYEWLYLTVAEDGVYTISGLSPLTFFIWPDYPDQATVPETAPFVWNVDNITSILTDSIEVELVAGTYLVGFRYDGIDAAGNYICEVGEYTYTITRSEKPAHEHEFVEGKCECGEEDPNYVPPVDDNPVEPELTLIQKIIKAITEFFAKIGAFFKNFFVKK